MGGVDVDDLYGLPLDQFIPERTALSRELRKAGNRHEAAEVAALRKPSVAAWAVNQLVRTQREAVAELFGAGDALRSAQDDVLGGRGDARSLRAAVDGERIAVEALTDAARGLLTSAGDELSATILERVADTLHAAAFDDEAREQVREGRLERELRHVGLGVMGSPGATATAPAPAPSAARRAATKKKAESGEGKGKKQAAAQGRELRERAKARDEARREARATEREARRRAERAERAAQVALERRDNAAVALSEAEAELEAAQDALGDAQARLRDAEHAAREAGR